MTDFKDWLEAELRCAKDALEAIPQGARKGPAVSLLRQRAREALLALRLHMKYEALREGARLIPFRIDPAAHARANAPQQPSI